MILKICDRCGAEIKETQDYMQAKSKSIKITMFTTCPTDCFNYDLCDKCEDVVLSVLEPLPKLNLYTEGKTK